MVDEDRQPFMSHLEELRKRLIACAIAAGVGFVICYFFREYLFGILIAPLKAVMPEGERLIFTNLPEMFLTYLKVAFLAGVLLSAPFIFYQLWMFVAPGLYQKEKRLAIPFVVASSILFVGGALFGYFVVFPFGFKFFMAFSNESVQALPSVKQYFSFSIKLLFAFGVVFELPVVVFFLTKMRIVTPDFLKQKRKYAILMTFVLGAILTPPDVITQCMMAGPLILLYEIGILVSKTAYRRREKESNGEDTEAAL
ncbi:MAG: twin-arginine translocase subunit TatC [Deltaproteobacteria bacterium]|nr:twin-arginine translocase subunit TatC [Deltaproteobacteria bacterium]MBW1922884.1 twin-arginine translocase subunit TatC [Deltaproteobacteria bacterium]MBW1948899.1 twin-arginine translocase subunit TatC [Deltaproteobacteria bacterium]MBW2008020.1 twin-arginine translocase subunit TatC [Deltaproteobacteria bacterium]MBW2101819.1 twin-arginine translocase subunit TatC [Deltaproteobacteria bacterium]